MLLLLFQHGLIGAAHWIINRCAILGDRALIVVSALACGHGAQDLLDRLYLLSNLALALVTGADHPATQTAPATFKGCRIVILYGGSRRRY